jgi:hypothetical protein
MTQAMYAHMNNKIKKKKKQERKHDKNTPGSQTIEFWSLV